jgi:hypothetical protein
LPFLGHFYRAATAFRAASTPKDLSSLKTSAFAAFDQVICRREVRHKIGVRSLTGGRLCSSAVVLTLFQLRLAARADFF